MKRAKAGRKSFEKDGRAYKLFLSKLAERPGFDESYCNHALEYAYKETYRVTKPLKPSVKQRLLGFVPRYRAKIQEDLELIRRKPHIEIPAPGDHGHEQSGSSGDESVDVEVNAAKEGSHQRIRIVESETRTVEPRRTWFNGRCELDDELEVQEHSRRRAKSKQGRLNYPAVEFEDFAQSSNDMNPSRAHDEEEEVRNEASGETYRDESSRVIMSPLPQNENRAPQSVIKQEIDISAINLNDDDEMDREEPRSEQNPGKENNIDSNNNGRNSAVNNCSCANKSSQTTVIINTGTRSISPAPSNGHPIIICTSSSSSNGTVYVPLENQYCLSPDKLQKNIEQVEKEIEKTKEKMIYLNAQLKCFKSLAKKNLTFKNRSKATSPAPDENANEFGKNPVGQSSPNRSNVSNASDSSADHINVTDTAED